MSSAAGVHERELRFIGMDEASRPLRILSIASQPADHTCLKTAVGGTAWEIQEASSYREATKALCAERFPVIVCEQRLMDGSWKDILGQVCMLHNAPRLLVTAADPDDRLWAEVLNMGGFDVLLKPLRASEVTRVIDFAYRSWEAERSRKPAGRAMHA